MFDMGCIYIKINQNNIEVGGVTNCEKSNVLRSYLFLKNDKSNSDHIQLGTQKMFDMGCIYIKINQNNIDWGRHWLCKPWSVEVLFLSKNDKGNSDNIQLGTQIMFDIVRIVRKINQNNIEVEGVTDWTDHKVVGVFSVNIPFGQQCFLHETKKYFVLKDSKIIMQSIAKKNVNCRVFDYVFLYL